MLRSLLLERYDARDVRVKVVDERFVELLRSCGVGVGDMEMCRKKFDVLKCNDGGERVARCWGCKKPTCPICMRGRAAILAQDAIQEFMKLYREVGLAKPYGLELVFTASEDMYERIGDLKKLAAVAWDTINEMFAGLPSGKKMGSHGKRDVKRVLCGLGAAQYWSSSDPIYDGYYPHVHFIVPCIAFGVDGSLEKPSSRTNPTVPYFLPADELVRLKKIWTRRVCEAFGGSTFVSRMGKSLNVNVHYVDNYGGLGRAIGYAVRSYAVDAYKVVKEGNYFVRLSKEEYLAKLYSHEGVVGKDKYGKFVERLDFEESRVDKIEFLRLLVRPKGERRNKWYGWLSNANSKDYYKTLDIEFKKRAERIREMTRLVCPEHHCGYTLELAGCSFDYIVANGIKILTRPNRDVTVAMESVDVAGSVSYKSPVLDEASERLRADRERERIREMARARGLV